MFAACASRTDKAFNPQPSPPAAKLAFSGGAMPGVEENKAVFGTQSSELVCDERVDCGAGSTFIKERFCKLLEAQLPKQVQCGERIAFCVGERWPVRIGVDADHRD